MSKEVSVNRQAFHNYDILEKFEAGSADGNRNQIGSRRPCEFKGFLRHGERRRGLAAKLSHQPVLSHDNYANHDPLRTRKLLMHTTFEASKASAMPRAAPDSEVSKLWPACHVEADRV